MNRASPFALQSRVSLACVMITLSSALGCSRRHEPVPAPVPAEPLPPNLEDLPVGGLPRTVVLVTVDGARWQDVLGGADPELTNEDVDDWTSAERLLPNIYGFVRRSGVALGGGRAECGIVRAANGSNVSLPGYMEILGGRATSCVSNACAASSPTILDEATSAGVTPVASIASWELMDRAATARRVGGGITSSAGRHGWIGARPNDERLDQLFAAGASAPVYPAPDGDYRPDPHTAAIALQYLRTARPRFLHVALGDSDEYAHRGDYVGYLHALRRADDFLGELVAVAGDRATFLVTADHGRATDFRYHGARYPESARSFVIAFGHGVAAQNGCASREILLADVGATVRVLLGLAADTSPGAGRAISEIAHSDP